MLASITPLGERGRRTSYARTATAFALGSAAAGAASGAIAGALGSLLPSGGPGGTVRLAVLAAALVAGLALDAGLGGLRLPTVRRQVNEQWMHAYRGWVYGAGFGLQLGAGVVTIVTTALTYVALLAALLTGNAGLGAAVGACYGVARGATLLAGARVQRPEQLVALHRRVTAWSDPARRLTLGAEAALAAACLGAALA